MKFGNKIPGFDDVYYTSTQIAENKDHEKVLQLLSGKDIVAVFTPYYHSGAENTWRLEVGNDAIVQDPNGEYVHTNHGATLVNTAEIAKFFNSMIKQFKLKSVSFGEKTKTNSGFTFGTPQREI